MRKKLSAAVLGITLLTPQTILAEEYDWGAMAIATFETVGASPSFIKNRTKGYTSDSWYNVSVAEVTTAGAVACAVPLYHLAALAAEFPYYLREVHNSALGMGSIIYGEISPDDFEIIMTYWANDTIPAASELEYIAEVSAWAAGAMGSAALSLSFSQLADKFAVAEGVSQKTVREKVVDGITDSVRLEITKKILTKAVGKKLGVKVGSKFAAKAGAKIGTKIAVKYGGKAASGWFPIAGALACGGANGYIMATVLDSAEAFYQAKSRAISRLK
jgi:hypothetical protein